MDHEIRPISQAPTAVDGNRDSYVPESPRKMPPAKAEPVVEEREIRPQPDRTNSMESEKGEMARMAEGATCEEDGIDWNPGFKQQFPWIGFAGLMTIILATGMAIAILGMSNHKRVKDWPIARYPTPPNVLLNIANQVQNLGVDHVNRSGFGYRLVAEGAARKQPRRSSPEPCLLVQLLRYRHFRQTLQPDRTRSTHDQVRCH